MIIHIILFLCLFCSINIFVYGLGYLKGSKDSLNFIKQIHKPKNK